MYKAGILTISDKGSRGERQDESGPIIREILTQNGFDVANMDLVADEMADISQALIRMSDDLKLDLIITTGGTGLAPRDVTPEATMAVLTRNVPGISEAMRSASLSITKRAMLSRGVSGLRHDSLIINLPGSPKACRENLLFIISELDHGIAILKGDSGDHAHPPLKKEHQYDQHQK